MRENLNTIINKAKHKKKLAITGVIIMTTTILFGTAFVGATMQGSTTQSTNQYIGQEKAKAIALKHANLNQNQVTFIKCYLDYDNHQMVYDVEFYSGNTEYDYEINAINGIIHEFDHEIEHHVIPNTSTNTTASNNISQPAQNTTPSTNQYIGQEKAKAIALANAGFTASEVRKLKVKLDREHGKMIYEVEFDKGQTEYEYEIDALSGTILDLDVDYDD